MKERDEVGKVGSDNDDLDDDIIEDKTREGIRRGRPAKPAAGGVSRATLRFQ